VPLLFITCANGLIAYIWQMFKKCLAAYLSVYFLLGAMLLPKGDFALLADIPGMYQHYKQIDDPKDIGIADFVIDYLLNAEGILGADYYKGRPIPYNTVQFQHGANFLTFVLPSYTLPHSVEQVYLINGISPIQIKYTLLIPLSW